MRFRLFEEGSYASHYAKHCWETAADAVGHIPCTCQSKILDDHAAGLTKWQSAVSWYSLTSRSMTDALTGFWSRIIRAFGCLLLAS